MPSNGKKVIKNKVNLLLARLQNATLVDQPNEDKGRDITLDPDLNKHRALHNPEINFPMFAPLDPLHSTLGSKASTSTRILYSVLNLLCTTKHLSNSAGAFQ